MLREDEGLVTASTSALRIFDADFILQTLNVNSDATKDDHAAQAHPENHFKTAVEVLLEWSPRSAYYVDKQGRLPLAHALMSGKSWESVQSVITACPRAVKCRDRSTGLYMFQLAAMHAPDLETIYAITRTTPEYLQVAATDTTTTATLVLADAASPAAKKRRQQETIDCAAQCHNEQSEPVPKKVRIITSKQL